MLRAWTSVMVQLTPEQTMIERITFNGKTVLVMQTEQRENGYAWAVLNATDVELTRADGLPSEWDARQAVINCATQILTTLSDGMKNA
jgi:hypothetical protein